MIKSKYIFFFLISILIYIGISILHPYVFQLLENNEVYAKRVEKYEMSVEYFVLTILIGPVIEEFLYRKGLIYSKSGTTLLIIGLIYTLYIPFQPSAEDFTQNPLYLLLFFSIPILFFFSIRHVVKNNENKIRKFYDDRLWLIITVSIVFFAYSHFSLHENYMQLKNVVFSPIILFSYFIAGIVFSLFRLKCGFIWGCLIHILWNTIIVFENIYNFF